LNVIADTDDVERVTIAVNGEPTGLTDRSAVCRRWKQVLGI
jgi:predicted chitinase